MDSSYERNVKVESLITITDSEFCEFKQLKGTRRQKFLQLDKVCSCCRLPDVTLIRLKNCTHKGFLAVNFSSYIDFTKGMLCQCCHEMLKKIEKFKRQVLESILNKQDTIDKKWTSLKRSQIITLTHIEPEQDEIPETRILTSEISEQDIGPKEEYLSDESTISDIEEIPVSDLYEVHVKKDKTPNVKIKDIQADAIPPQPKIDSIVKKEHNYSICDRKVDKPPVLKKVVIQPRYMVDNPEKTTTASTATKTLKANTRTKNRRVVDALTETVKQNHGSQLYCPQCPASFKVETAYNKHIKQHERINEYYSKIKEITLKKEDMEKEREKRRLRQYAKFDYKCEKCLASFLLEETLQGHMKKHVVRENSYVCEVCECVYSTERSLKMHSNIHWTRYQCMECDEIFEKETCCIKHFNTKHGQKGRISDYYVCKRPNCNFTAPDLSSYRRHKLKNHSQKVPCEVCDKYFASVNSLKLHIKYVHESSVYECKHCGGRYKNASSLSQHIKMRHKKNCSEIAYCSECDKQFRDKYSLAVHLTTTSRHMSDDMKKFVCDICGERFVSKVLIRSHIEVTHVDVRHPCEECEKVFTCTRALKRHKRQHRAPRPLEKKLCQICGKGFKIASTLKHHILAHKGLRPYHCSFCPANFSYSGALYTHKRLVHKVPMKKTQETDIDMSMDTT